MNLLKRSNLLTKSINDELWPFKMKLVLGIFHFFSCYIFINAVALDLTDESINFRFDGQRASTGKIVRYPNNPDYFGYSKPLRHNDALHFCNSFRGNIIVPETDKEMRLVQGFGEKIWNEFEKEEFKKKNSSVDTSPVWSVRFRTLWLGIRFRKFKWVSYAAGNQRVVANYWSDKKRAHLINILKVDLGSVDHGISIYSSSKWSETPVELLNVICINTTEMKDLQNFGKLPQLIIHFYTVLKDNIVIEKGLSNHNASKICEEKHSLSTFPVNSMNDFGIFVKIIEKKEENQI